MLVAAAILVLWLLIQYVNRLSIHSVVAILAVPAISVGAYAYTGTTLGTANLAIQPSMDEMVWQALVVLTPLLL